MTQLNATVELIASSFELMRGKITDTDWLRNFASAAGAESAHCVRWTVGRPDSVVTSAYGYLNELPANWAAWADHVLELERPTEAMLLDDLVDQLGRIDLMQANPVNDPQILIGVCDWQPANMFIVTHRDAQLGPWTPEERSHFLELCRLTRRSMQLHKDYARAHSVASTTMDMLNASPRGIISLSLDGGVHFANNSAEFALNQNDGISRRNGKLHIDDRHSRAQLDEFIATAALLKLEQIDAHNPAAYRDIPVKRSSGLPDYQLRVNAIRVSGWSVELHDSDRTLLAYVYDPSYRTPPTAAQLKSYYGLTRAQSKVAIELYTTNNIVTVAERLNITVNTARTHLRSIYEKTNTNTQSQLVTLIGSTIKTYGETARPG